MTRRVIRTALGLSILAAFTATACKGDQAGEGDPTEENAQVAPPPSGPHVVDLGLTPAFACAALSDGSLWCWGSNDVGQLGLRDREDRDEPTQVPGLTNIVEVEAAGGDSGQTCARDNQGAVWCWGQGLNALGRAPGAVETPTRVELPSPAVDLAVGRFHFCAAPVKDQGWVQVLGPGARTRATREDQDKRPRRGQGSGLGSSTHT
ncbi:MAG: hypothetical protein KC561_09895 [Myxococcales bacterium]|nr:hypothetical protein [Myxococcales bacterium]